MQKQDKRVPMSFSKEKKNPAQDATKSSKEQSAATIAATTSRTSRFLGGFYDCNCGHHICSQFSNILRIATKLLQPRPQIKTLIATKKLDKQ